MKLDVHLGNLIGFIAVLTAIVLLSLAGKATDLAIMTGLVGVLGTFKPWGAGTTAEQEKTTQDVIGKIPSTKK